MANSTKKALLSTLLTLSALPLCAQAEFGNPSFESPALSPNTFVSTPTNVPGWSFFGNSGLANGNTTWGPGARTGAQYAFIRNDGRIAQTITNLQVGQPYRLHVWMKASPGLAPLGIGMRYNASPIALAAKPTGEWREHVSNWFVANSSTVTFDFISSNNQWDDVSVIDDAFLEAGPELPFGPFANGDFEAPDLGTINWLYQVGGVDSGWVFSFDAGLQKGAGPWGSGSYTGQQFAFIQRFAYMEQPVGNLEPGSTYHVEWMMRRRNGDSGGNTGQPIRVLFAGSEIFPLTNYNSSTWKAFASRPFIATSTQGLLRFQGGPDTGDKTENIDLVRFRKDLPFSPLSLEVMFGILTGGNLGSLLESDDNHLQFSPSQNIGRTDAPVHIVLESTAPNNGVSYLAATVESGSTGGELEQTVELWNFFLGVWETLYVSTVRASETTSFGAKFDDAANFVQGGTGKVRCRIIYRPLPDASRTWTVRIDQVRFYVAE